MARTSTLVVSLLAAGLLLLAPPAGATISALTVAPIAPALGVPFSGTVATFAESDATLGSGDYTATIAWGDATSSAGTVTGGAGRSA